MSKEEIKEIYQNNQEEDESYEGSESSENSIELNTLVINKEISNTITIDNDSYHQLITFLQDLIKDNETLKKKLNKSYFSKSIQTEKINIIDEQIDKEKEKKKNEMKNLEIINKELKEKLEELKKENDKNLKQIEQFKLDLKNQNDLNLSKLNKLDLEKKELENQIQKLKENGQRNNFREIYSNPKLLNNITNYINFEDKISLSKSNSKLFHELFFKTKSEVLEKKLNQKEEMINNFNKENIYSRFKINESEIENLYKDYILGDKISGKELRDEIVQSLIFLKKFVKIPLKNFKGGLSEKQEKGFFAKNSKGSLFGRLSSFIKGEEQTNEENIFNLDENEDAVNNNYNTIKFTDEEFKNIIETDRTILETYNTDKTINVKFEYEKSDSIKELLNEYFKSQLPKPAYNNFLTKICEIFPDLLYASFCALKDIKNLEIVKYTLYCRYMRAQLKIDELYSEIQDLNQFAESSRTIKEMLLKQKHEADIKYNNSLMIITQVNEEKGNIQKKVNELEQELNNSSKQFDDYKMQISNEYKKIKNDFELIQKEKDLLKGTLLDFKNYFMKFIGNDGEIIEK